MYRCVILQLCDKKVGRRQTPGIDTEVNVDEVMIGYASSSFLLFIILTRKKGLGIFDRSHGTVISQQFQQTWKSSI